jgi:hypothetical protein
MNDPLKIEVTQRAHDIPCRDHMWPDGTETTVRTERLSSTVRKLLIRHYRPSGALLRTTWVIADGRLILHSRQ